MFEKFCYTFEEGNENLKHLIGERGVRLCGLSRIGLPVPAGFIITEDAAWKCLVDDGVQREVLNCIGHLKLTRTDEPFYVSVRAGKYLTGAGILNVNADNADELFKAVLRVHEKCNSSVIIQPMVFGNASENSGTGVVFLMNPHSKEKSFFGEFLDNAQGNDVVFAVRLPMTMQKMSEDERFKGAYSNLEKACEKIRGSFPNACDVDFTVEKGKLFILDAHDL